MKESIRNKAEVMMSRMCGCYYCLKAYRGDRVTCWSDDGETALCPYCGIDSVLPGITDLGVLKDLKSQHFPCCPHWKKQIEKINDLIKFHAAKTGNPAFWDGRQFEYCPWCGDNK